MRRGIVRLVWLFAAALLAACGPPTDVDPAGATLTAMVAAVASPDTPEPAADTPTPAAPGASLPSGGTPTPLTLTPTPLTLTPTPLTLTPTPATASGTPPPAAQAAACQGQIVFIRRDKSDYGIYTINADGSEMAELVADPGSLYDLSVSPDGARIVYAAQKNGAYGVFVADSSGQVQRLGVGGYGSEPTWSPDGEQILLHDWQGLGTELYVVDAGSGESQQITDSSAHKTGPAWSPDGDWIAYTMLDSYNQGDVWVMPAPGGAAADGDDEAVNLTQHPAHDCCVAWSPDGTRLAFLSSRADEGAQPAGAGAFAAYRWTETLVRTAYKASPLTVENAPRPLTTVISEPPHDIYLVGRDGGGLLNLTGGPSRESDPAWAPDGRRLAYVSNRDGNHEIYVANADGSGQMRLTHSLGNDYAPLWSPDGACLAFASYEGGDYGIYLLPVPSEPDAGPVEPWKLVDGGNANGGLQWVP
jgi:TolB protein